MKPYPPLHADIETNTNPIKRGVSLTYLSLSLSLSLSHCFLRAWCGVVGAKNGAEIHVVVHTYIMYI
jgi:hypothetical protein